MPEVYDQDALYSVRCTDKEHFGSDTRFSGSAGLMPLGEALEAANMLNGRAVTGGRGCTYVPRKADDRPVLTRSEAAFVLMHALQSGLAPPDFTHADIVDESTMDTQLGFTA